MRFLRFLSACVAVAVSVTSAAAFSGPGHEFVGALAEDLLIARSKSPDKAEAARATAALAKAHKMLGTLSFADAATIPDELKDFDHRNGEADAVRQARIAKRKTAWGQPLADLFTTFHEKNSDTKSPHYHHKLHFADIAIPGTGPLVYSATALGAEPYDVVQTLKFCEQRLRGKIPDDGRGITPEVALVYMIHLVGDLHQPLHVGSEYLDTKGHPVNPTAEDLKAKRAFKDVGGNNLRVEKAISPPNGFGPGNLHHAWDDDIPDDAFEAWRVKLDPKMHKTNDQIPLAALLADAKFEPADWKPKAVGDAAVVPTWEAWATEILPLAREAHSHFKMPFPKDPDGGWDAVLKKAENYDGKEAAAAQRELLLAGWRLSWVIEEALGGK